MCILFIDSAKIDEITIKIVSDNDEIVIKTQTKNMRGSQIILQSIQAILEKTNKTLSDIEAIHLYNGPGSYTGRRVGASIANALAYTLHIPINEKSLGTFVYPSYE